MSGNEGIVLTDYKSARQYAEDIYSIATAINNVFDEQTDNMTKLFGTDWQSDGSITTSQDDLKRFGEKYKPLYEKLVATSTTVHNAANTYEAGDQQATDVVTAG